MAFDLKKYTRLKERVEQLREEASQAEGAYNELLSQLKKEYGCANIKSAQALLKKLETEERGLEEELDTKLKEFEHKWGDRL